jgi:cytochrome P450
MAMFAFVNRDGDRWEQPDAFYPAQCMAGRELPDPYDFAPFGGGYRRCPGAAFALSELKVLTAEIVQRCRLVVPGGTVVRAGMLGPIPGPIGPVPARVEQLRAACA